MALTDIAIRNAKPGMKPIKMADEGGMFLLVAPTGGKLWRLKYRIDGREKQRDKVRAAYHRGAHWKERVEMAQWWSDYLDQLRKGVGIVPFPDRKAV